MNIDLSIIVAFDNNKELMSNFLEHLISIKKLDNTEIILISDGCQRNDTLQYIDSFSKNNQNVRLITLPHKLGYSKANNIGVKASFGKYLLFINTDVFPKENSIEMMIEYLNNHQVGAVQGLLIYPQNLKVQSTGHAFNDYMNNHLYNGREYSDKFVNISGERQALTTAFCMVEKKIFYEVGKFNEFYFNAYDGMEMTLKITLAGYKCIYLSEAHAYHSTGGTRNELRYDNEYQSKYFYSHLSNKIQSDIKYYLKLQIESFHLEDEYYVINCSFAQNWKDILDYLNIKFNYFCDIQDRGEKNIDLYHNLTYQFLDDKTPLLFIANNFRDLSANRNWFEIRNNANDLILDYHGNIVNVLKVFSQ